MSIATKLRPGIRAEAVLTTLRQFPSLEPVRLQPVSSQLLNLPVRRDILWQAVMYERDRERVGSKTILGRSDLDYSRKKLRPQKGSGRARMGDRANPIRHDGARAHNRHAPNDWATGLPSAVYSRAIRTALSQAYANGRLIIVDSAEFEHSHPLVGENFIKQHGAQKLAVTFVTAEHRPNLFDATAELDRVDVVPAELVTVQDLLKAQRLIIEFEALQYLAGRTMGSTPSASTESKAQANVEA